jgi:tetratricopeptide (TPR) repeat protein
MRELKIFISSPSDVRPERLIAQRVIERLDKEFQHHFRLRPMLWEREPLIATEHFQTMIAPPAEADIMVVAVWSRLGVRLPPDKFAGRISRGAVTGTEWEFEEAVAAYRARGLPDILFYRKRAPVLASLEDDDELQRRLEDKRAVDRFFRTWFLDETQNTFRAAAHEFADTLAFEQLLETHLRALLQKRIEQGGETTGTVRWHQGSPFRGLESFEPEHAPVFFGRTRARNELRDLLARREAAGNSFVLVMGASGVGKSSLVKAGLLPDLALPGMVGKVALCRHAVMRAGGTEEPLEALAAALCADTALPELAALRVTPARLAALLRAAPAEALLPINQGLDAARRAAGLLPGAEIRLALVVDQLEELFTAQARTPEARDRFVAVLAALAAAGQVWVVATMRSDFFDRLETLPALARLSEGGRYLLTPPDDAEIGQIVLQPVLAAGLRFELDGKTGVSLDEAIRRAAGRNPGTLPLLEFLLDQLWQARSPAGMLTFAAYEALGGLEGALGRRAEAVFAGLAADVQGELPSLLRALVTVGQGSEAAATARLAPLAQFPPGTPRRALIDSFLSPAARLLVVEGEGEAAQLRVAHEALLTHWERARRQISADRSDLQIRARLEQAAALWSAATDQRDSLLLRPGLPLSEAEDFLARRGGEVEAPVQRFVAESAAAARQQARRGLRRLQAAAAVLLLLSAGAVAGAVFGWMGRNAANRNFEIAVAAADAVVTQIAGELKDVRGVSAQRVGDILVTAQRTFEQLLAEGGDSDLLRHRQAMLLASFADSYATLGLDDAQAKAAEQSLALMTALAARHAGDAALQASRLVALEKVGDVQARRGDLAGALALYDEAETGWRGLAARRPDSLPWQRAHAAVAVKIGEILIDRDEQARARDLFRASLAVARELAAREPGSAAQAAVSKAHMRLANALHDLGEFDTALVEVRAAAAIRAELVRAEPSSIVQQQELAVCYHLEGTILLDQGKFGEALAAFARDRALVEGLLRGDPGDTALAFHLAVNADKEGTIHLRAGRLDAAEDAFRRAQDIRRRLLETAPDNGPWQRYGAVSLRRLADVAAARGQIDAALALRREALAIVETLAGRIPSNTAWQLDRADIRRELAVLQKQAGDTAGARQSLTEAAAIIDDLLQRDPGNRRWLAVAAEIKAARGS